MSYWGVLESVGLGMVPDPLGVRGPASHSAFRLWTMDMTTCIHPLCSVLVTC